MSAVLPAPLSKTLPSLGQTIQEPNQKASINNKDGFQKKGSKRSSSGGCSGTRQHGFAAKLSRRVLLSELQTPPNLCSLV